MVLNSVGLGKDVGLVFTGDGPEFCGFGHASQKFVGIKLVDNDVKTQRNLKKI